MFYIVIPLVFCLRLQNYGKIFFELRIFFENQEKKARCALCRCMRWERIDIIMTAFLFLSEISVTNYTFFG